MLVDGEPQVEELELAVVPVEHVATRRAVLAGAAHVLSQAVQGGALLGIALRIVSIGISDVFLEWRDPVDLVCALERHRDHGRLRHRGRRGWGKSRAARRAAAGA